MPKEIERKFLITNNGYKPGSSKRLIRQGFLSNRKEAVVRVRIIDNEAFLTIKGPTKVSTRLEYEYAIPIEEAGEMLSLLCERPLIEKYRYIVDFEGFTWEVDEFLGENEGLVVAEIELEHESQEFPKPGWLGDEVTDDQRYYNANLIKNPYKSWK